MFKSIYTSSHINLSVTNILAEWLSANDWRSICGITLTLKQTLPLDPGTWVKIDETRAKDAFQHFMHRLNRSILGRRYRDRGQQLRVIPVLEKGERWHYHIAIEPPECLNADIFATRVRYCWSCVDWAYGNVEIKAKVDDGWITNYILKNKNGLLWLLHPLASHSILISKSLTFLSLFAIMFLRLDCC